MEIKIDPDKCIGCGTCVAIAPKTFRMNDATNKAEVVNPPWDDDETIKMGAESCPTVAIEVSE